MKKLTLALLPIIFLLSCQNNAPDTAQGSMFPKSDQLDHLDRFEQSIQGFEQSDEQDMPPKGAILFTGSSSIRMWESLEKDFAPLPVINRGFGGSTLPEVTHYADRIIYKYEPQLMVLYCGENDISEGDPPIKVFQSFKSSSEKPRRTWWMYPSFLFRPSHRPTAGSYGDSSPNSMNWWSVLLRHVRICTMLISGRL